jgi:hypothetical protein
MFALDPYLSDSIEAEPGRCMLPGSAVRSFQKLNLIPNCNCLGVVVTEVIRPAAAVPIVLPGSAQIMMLKVLNDSKRN